MNQPGLQTVLSLRLLSLVAFPAGAALLAIYQRSPLALAGLAGLMLAVSLVERRRLSIQQVGSGSLFMGFAFRLGLLIGVFILFTGVMTLFRDTALARSIATPDLLILGGTTLTALAANEISARIAGRQIADVRTGLEAAIRAQQGGPAAEGQGEILEGEIIDADPPR
jgi:hypothetical protein